MAYSTQADIETEFGERNVSQWADLDGDRNATAIAARVALAIASADSEIDDRLRGRRYTVPFTTTPALIGELSRKLAGVKLYEARGVQDWNPETGQPSHRLEWVRRWCMDTIEGLVEGKIRLDAATTRLTPELVEFETAADEEDDV